MFQIITLVITYSSNTHNVRICIFKKKTWALDNSTLLDYNTYMYVSKRVLLWNYQQNKNVKCKISAFIYIYISIYLYIYL